MAAVDTKTKILDAAEWYFAEMGFYTTSLRQVTERAGVNVASVNYHFGGKENLMDAVLKRRILPLNEVRLARLDEAMERAGKADREPTVREILDGFMGPTLRTAILPEFRNLSLIMGRVFTDHNGEVMARVAPLIDDLIAGYVKALCGVLPGLTRDEVGLRFRMALGAMHHAILAMRGAGSLTTDLEEEAVMETLIDFASRGMGGA